MRIHINGIVQGVGFRPFVYKVATRNLLRGWVRNTSSGVDIEVEGTESQLGDFVQSLKYAHPPLAQLDTFVVNDCPPGGFSQFRIRNSEAIPDGFIPISPDVTICEDCLKEMFDPTDRRFLYPFINCTNCGPRFTIIEDIPYDRLKTTMAAFEMCPDCQQEYENPLDRRFHAQPVACPDCGPQVWLEYSGQPSWEKYDYPAIAAARMLISQGKIVAVKGLGGFHLACDATNHRSVEKLRHKKLRVDKPFAVMMADIETTARFCQINTYERDLLQSRQRPIVLLSKNTNNGIASDVAPNQNTLGVMLPYTPLHYLLFKQPINKNAEQPIKINDLSALVMTSGNLSEEPIAFSNEEARERLSSLADAFLMHDREIHIRCDDSVYRVLSVSSEEDRNNSKNEASLPATQSYPLRRSRGYAPNPLQLPWDSNHDILATGTALKNTFCLTKGRYAFLSHHIGDLENFETLQSFEEGITHFERLFRIEPEVIACDLHPNYLASRYAQARAEASALPIFQIQHHHAHIAACMADNDLRGDRPVIGVSFDGTGYGDDGAIWGGEFFLADYEGYHRFAHLAYMPLPGGDAAIRKPARIALAYLWKMGFEWDEGLPPVSHLCSDEKTLLRSMLANDINSPSTSSMGRLFDSVAAITGLRGEVNYEGQAAIELEALADSNIQTFYPFEIQRWNDGDKGFENSPITLITKPLFQNIISDMHDGIPISSISAKFHNSIANMVLELCQIMRREFNVEDVVLSGGVWQNYFLLKKTVSSLKQLGFTVFIHRHVPPNDGGLSLGQASIASYQMM